MPSAIRYVTKDSHPTLQALAEQKRRRLLPARHSLEQQEKQPSFADASTTAPMGIPTQPPLSSIVKGRRYTHAIASSQAGAIQAHELLKGMQYACLSITDDEPDTLKKVSASNPWQMQVMTMLCGNSETEANLPLSTILSKYYDLQLDHVMNISGVSPAGHMLDTQGYIAHNDTTIVLAYRCTTSVKDWLTNLTTTTSAWELEPDVQQGHSGYVSACTGFGCCPTGSAAAGNNTNDDGRTNDSPRPRVHTGFYNNFLVTVPIIRQYIDPLLLDPAQPSRTLYVVGHSLGAGIAVMAACYFILDEQCRYNWRTLPHQLRVVTAGGPRAVNRAMQHAVDSQCRALRDTNKVVVARLVRDKDVVPTVPPQWLGFRHLEEKLVYLTKEDQQTGVGQVLVNPNLSFVLSKRQVRRLQQQEPHILGLPVSPLDGNEDTEFSSSGGGDDEEDASMPYQIQQPAFEEDLEVVYNVPSTTAAGDGNDGTADAATKAAQYQKLIACIPRAFRDHMPEFYLLPLVRLQEQQQQAHGSDAPVVHDASKTVLESSQSQPHGRSSAVDDTEWSRTSNSMVVEYQPLVSKGSSSWSKNGPPPANSSSTQSSVEDARDSSRRRRWWQRPTSTAPKLSDQESR
jgi:Lipase (class 3)